MYFLILITITAIHLAYPYVASDKFRCTEPDQHGESFSQLTTATTLWNETKMNFITRFSDGRNKLRHRLEVKHCWPDDMNGNPNDQQKADRATQKKRKPKQRYMDYNQRGFKPNYLQQKSQQQLMEYPNATCNDFSAHNIQEDLMLQVSSNFLHDVEQIKTEVATLGREMRNLRVDFQLHRVDAIEGNSKPWAPTQKGKQKTFRFCNYCHKNGHTPNWCRKKKCETKKYEKYNMKCSPKGIMFLTRTMALMLSTAAPNTIKMWIDILIRMMATTQITNFNLRKKKPGKMNPTKSLPLNKNTFTGTMACALMRHSSLQPASLTMNCLTRFHWATEAFEKSF